MFGLHRRKRIAFLVGNGEARLGRSKAGPGPFEKGRDGSVFASHRRERIAFPPKFGDARLGRLKVGLGRSNIIRFHEKRTKV